MVSLVLLTFIPSYLKIPNGTYPENRLIDGALGAYEDPYDGQWPIELGEEADLDFEAAIPLIWPQKTVLFQEDDQYYEYTGAYSGFWNSEPPMSSFCPRRFTIPRVFTNL